MPKKKLIYLKSEFSMPFLLLRGLFYTWKNEFYAQVFKGMHVSSEKGYLVACFFSPIVGIKANWEQIDARFIVDCWFALKLLWWCSNNKWFIFKKRSCKHLDYKSCLGPRSDISYSWGKNDLHLCDFDSTMCYSLIHLFIKV